MEFIGLCMKGANGFSNEEDLRKIVAIIKLFNYEPVLIRSDFDEEIIEGLDKFIARMQITSTIFLNHSGHRKVRFSSNGIMVEFRRSVERRVESVFERCLKEIVNLGLKCKLYVVFAYTWYEDTDVRFQIGTVEELTKYLRMNMGWTLRFLNYADLSLTAELDLPLVHELI